MKPEIHISNFFSNTPRDIDTILSGLRMGVTKNGTINVHFQTKDKYVIVEDDGVMFSGDETAMCFSIKPFIYDNGEYLEDTNYEAYIDHPEYYQVRFELVVENTYYSMVVTPLKHEYFVSFVSDDEIMNYDCLGEI